jgi:hypothetical protein
MLIAQNAAAIIRFVYDRRTLLGRVRRASKPSPAHGSPWAGLFGSTIAVTARKLAGPCGWRRFTGETSVDSARRTWLLPRKPSSTLLRRRHITRGPHSKHSRTVNGSVAAGLGFLVPVVHNLAFTRTGRALVQVAVPSHPDEREAGAASRAPHVRRKRVEPHGKLWHLFTPPPPALPAQLPVHSPRASRGMPGSISRRSTRRSELGCGGHQGVRRRFGSGATRAATDNRLLAEARASSPLHRGLRVRIETAMLAS